MPAAIAAVAGMAAGAAVAGGMGLVAGTIAYGMVSGVTSMVVSSLVGGIIGSDEQDQQQESPAVAAARGMLLNTAGTVDPIPVLYGTRRIGGTRCLTEVSGADNTYLHIVLAHCEGEVDGFDAVYFDGTVSTDARFAGAFTLEHFTGADAQAASSSLVAALPAKWTTAHKLSGVAYTVARLTFNQDVWHGVPVITADIRGRKVFDPRDSTTAWSANPALCLRDYLTNARYGRGIAEASIDDATIIAAANYCDASITTPAGTQPRYTCNGLVDTSKSSIENVRALLTCMRGMLVFSGGKHKLVLDKADTAAFTFTEDTIVGAWNIALGNKRGRFNRVRANWTNPDNEWQPDIALAESAAYRVIDNALMLESKIDLPFTTDAYEAQMLGQRHLKQSRFGTIASFRATIAGLGCEVGDIVNITHDTPGWIDKAFRVVRIGLLSSDEVEVTAVEYDDSVYVAEPLTTPRVSVATNLPDPYTVAAPGTPDVAETLFETTGSAGVKARATMSWAAVVDAFVRDYLPEYRAMSPVAGAWVVLPASAALAIDINDIAPGQYEFRVRARNSAGVSSAYSATRAKEILGLTAPPADITGLGIQAAGGLAILTFALHPDLDVRQGGAIRARHSPSLSGATWETSTGIGEAGAGTATVLVLPLKAGTYLLKAEDSGGRPSVTAASISTKQATALAWSTLSSVQEDDDFLGTHSSTYVDGVDLQLGSDTLFDAATGTFDDAAGLFDYFGGVAAAGTYDFAAGMDLGVVSRVRLTSLIAASAVNVSTSFDETAGLFDDAAGLFDGTEGAPVDAWVEARETDDDPAGTPTWSTWKRLDAAEFVARGFDFRARLTSGDLNYTIKITQLRVAAEQIA